MAEVNGDAFYATGGDGYLKRWFMAVFEIIIDIFKFGGWAALWTKVLYT